MRLTFSLVFFCATLFGQPAFDAADVHVSARRSSRGPILRDGRFEMLRVTLVQLAAFAYNVDVDKVIGGPNWIDFDKFDVIAKTQPETSIQTGRLMLQALLADRFKLVVRKADAGQPQYALVMGKGKLQLKQSDGAGQRGCRSSTSDGSVNSEISCRGVPIGALVAALNVQRSGYLDAPIVEATGLTGLWDVDFRVTPSSARAAAADGTSLSDAVEKLGLKIERREVVVSSIVLERANETPTPNAANAEQALKLPPSATEFEVASVKPVLDGTNGPAPTTTPASGRLGVRGSLRVMIAQAWDLPSVAIVNGPRFLDTDRYEIVADAPASVPRPVDLEGFRPLLRALLQFRFGLVVHEEMRAVDTWVLTAPKKDVKMSPGANERGSCKSTPEKIPPNSSLSSAITCSNTTMAQLADRLPGMAPVYIENHPVIDETGLAGEWDFLVLWTGLSRINGRVNALAPGDRQEALSQPGSLTLFEALDKLGLKLTLEKLPWQVLVIDRVNPKPTEN